MARVEIRKNGVCLGDVNVADDGLAIGGGKVDDVRLADVPTGERIRVLSVDGRVEIESAIGGPRTLLAGEFVALGPYEIGAESGVATPPRVPTRVLSFDPASRKLTTRERVLEIREGGSAREWSIPDGRAIAGKDASCDLVLGDAYVSARHLAIDAFADRVEFRDLGSRNGTTQGGARVTGGEWAAGRTLTVGRTTLTLRSRESGETLAAGDRRVPGLVGDDAAIRELGELVHRVAPLDVTVLVRGETGTGKELVARAVHELSRRAAGPFVALNCATVPRDLFESELFGHVRGAFSGAVRDRRGMFALAHGGTLFLDEIGELPLDVQARLLRVLDDRRVRPVGGETPVACDVRVVAATHRDLERFVREGRFREDLWYRLNMVPLTLPPLRERLSDLDALAAHLMAREAAAQGRAAPTLLPETLEALRRHDWPGNVRELAAVLARAIILAGEGPVEPGHVMLSPLRRDAAIAMTLEEVEREAVRAALAEAPSRDAAAKRLGIAPSTLYEKIKKYELK
ncbi:MAG: sigma 54-interacting transcriptional regulator [Deltaproteobacteria bacterium]|nr:sigma 54-interacting transcriptional regulator [Deltaproteobacteria bacterium]